MQGEPGMAHKQGLAHGLSESWDAEGEFTAHSPALTRHCIKAAKAWQSVPSLGDSLCPMPTSGTCAAVGARQEQRQRYTAPPVETGATTPYLKVEEGHTQLHAKQRQQSGPLPPSISGMGRPLPLITMSRSVTTGGSDSTATHQMAAPPSPAKTSDAGEAQLAPRWWPGTTLSSASLRPCSASRYPQERQQQHGRHRERVQGCCVIAADRDGCPCDPFAELPWPHPLAI